MGIISLHNTPTLIHTDTLGRGFYTIRYLSPVTDVTPSVVEESQTLDIEGNRLHLTDGRGLVPLQYRYARLPLPCYQHSMDSGTQYTLLDVSGQPYHSWDAMDRETEITYDALRRPLERKVTESTITKTLEVYVYGEGMTGDKAHNLRGQIFKIYDGAGLVHIPEYDFKGNPLAQVRTYTDDATQHPDWTVITSVILETETYTTATQYDALSRPVKLITPDTGETSYAYDKGGLLKTVSVENVHGLDTDIVNNIEYDAKGQRAKIQYENGTTTTYEYDAFTFRVKRIRTTRHSDSKVLQDLHYWYDPVGNITLQKDDAQQTIYFDGTVAEPHNDYTYDALYRLIQAGGREHAGNNTAPDHNDNSRIGITPVPVDSTDTSKMRRYIQYYEYDEVGNFIEQRHTVTGSTSGYWTRYYTSDNNSNRLQSTKIGTSGTPEVYAYDDLGNIKGGMGHLNAGLLSMLYNTENRLERVVIDGNRTAYYQYNLNGQRVRKTIVNTSSGKTEQRKYIGEWEVFCKFDSSSLAVDTERETLHISDDTGRIALIDTRITGSGTEPGQLLRYQYSNHLQSATLELDDTGAIISYEEYYPYGSTSFQSGRSLAEVSLKRYRYTGKERDEESGLYYHGARYYIPWLCRWSAVDPISSDNYNLRKGYGIEKNRERDFLELTASPYEYCYDNPVRFTDPNGEQVPNSTIKKTPVDPNNITEHIYIVKANEIASAYFDLNNYGNAAAASTAKKLNQAALQFIASPEGRALFPGDGKATDVMNFVNLVGQMWNDQQTVAFFGGKSKANSHYYDDQINLAKTTEDKALLIINRSAFANQQRLSWDYSMTALAFTLASVGAAGLNPGLKNYNAYARSSELLNKRTQTLIANIRANATAAMTKRLANMEFKQLQSFTKNYSKEMNAFFNSNGTQVAPKEALLAYRELATRMLRGTGGSYQRVTEAAAQLHTQRIQMINKALEKLK